jgi:hypothetical protein
MSVLQSKEAVMGAGVKPSPFISSDHQNRAEIETDLAGMRPELYQRVLREVSEQVRLADGVATNCKRGCSDSPHPRWPAGRAAALREISKPPKFL